MDAIITLILFVLGFVILQKYFGGLSGTDLGILGKLSPTKPKSVRG